ncbi:MAG: 30S ribosomal protein S15 [Patescibacteria group bacterium]
MPAKKSNAKQARSKAIAKNQIHDTDNGSVEVQVAALTENINQLSDHLKKNRKDFSSRRGLLMMVGRRRKLMRYLKAQSKKRFQAITSKLGLRAD